MVLLRLMPQARVVFSPRKRVRRVQQGPTAAVVVHAGLEGEKGTRHVFVISEAIVHSRRRAADDLVCHDSLQLAKDPRRHQNLAAGTGSQLDGEGDESVLGMVSGGPLSTNDGRHETCDSCLRGHGLVFFPLSQTAVRRRPIMGGAR